jgi:hypothetical protein
MLLIVPPALLGQTPSAILHSQGGVWVNNYEAKDSTAVFAGDVVETKPGFGANLTIEGSAVAIQAESVTKFQGDWLELDHGGVGVETSKSFQVRVHCIRVTPVSNDWTQYAVTDVNGNIQVAAQKHDVNVEIERGHGKPAEGGGPQGGGTVHEGEQRSYNETQVCEAPARSSPAKLPLSTKWIAIGGGAVAGGIILCVLLCAGTSSTPISPDQP